MVRLTDHLKMTIVIDFDVKPQTKQNPLSKMVPSVPYSMSLNLISQNPINPFHFYRHGIDDYKTIARKLQYKSEKDVSKTYYVKS